MSAELAAYVAEEREAIFAAYARGETNELTKIYSVSRTAAYFAVSFAAHVSRAASMAGDATGLDAALSAWVRSGSRDWDGLAPWGARRGRNAGEIRPVESDLDALSIAVDFISAIAAERNIIAGLNVSRAAERLPEAIENALALVGHGDESRRWIMLAFERADALYEQIRLVLDGLDSEPAA